MATMIVLRLTMLAFSVVVLAPLPSHAIPVNVVATDGFMASRLLEEVRIQISGPDFAFTVDPPGLGFRGVLPGPEFNILRLGDTTDFSGSAPLDSRGSNAALVFEGVTYPVSGHLDFAVPVVTVALGVSAPFTMTGEIQGLGGIGVVAVDLLITGAGIMDASLAPVAPGQVALDSVEYRIVTPEPSAYLLAGSGIAVLLISRTIRRRRPKRERLA